VCEVMLTESLDTAEVHATPGEGSGFGAFKVLKSVIVIW